MFFIKKLTKEHPDNRLLLDSGNLLFKRKTVAKGINQERLTADTILTIYNDIEFDAVAVGPHDFAGGLALLKESNDNGFPWVSSNIVNDDGQLLFTDSIKKEILGQSIVIIAISNGLNRSIPGVRMQPWNEVLPPLIKQIRFESPENFIILLSSLNTSENKKITEMFPDISLLIGADSSKGNISPALTNKSIITQTASQGKYQGLMEITFGNSRIWGEDSQKKLAALQNKLGSLNWQLRRLVKKSKKADAPEKYTATITRLKNEKKVLTAKITIMEQQVIEEQKAGSNSDQFTYRFLALKKNMPNDQPTEEQIEKLNGDIKSLNRRKKEAKSPVGQALLIPVPLQLVGLKTCSSCHELQADFWAQTRHASAYDTLVQKERNLDLECLPCHMTVDVPGGKFDSLITESLLSYPKDLQAVGCETCHGNGKTHQEDPERFKLVRNPGINICLTCHTDEHDDNFQYQTKLEIISCPKA